MSVVTTRRSVLMGALGLAGAMTSFGAARAETMRLRLAWWGGSERTRRTQDVLNLYQQRITGVELAGVVSN
jgi:multiple sugar transport system substrate-binding protein